MEYILAAILIAVLALQEIRQRRLNKKNLNLSIENSKSTDSLKELQTEVVNLQDELGGEREKNRALLSQKKSSETRLGQISEHLIPFLDNCPYNPKDLHFLGNPIDYLVFDFDEGKITFLEVKSGNSKPSKRQKIIKNMIKCGRIYYDEIRVNEKGIKLKKIQNNYEETPITDGYTDEQE
jgi:predicted Holliday junction resolvase-like endonuclease